MYETLAVLAVFVLLYSISSVFFEKTPFNGALIFIAFGLAFGPLGLGILKLDLNKDGLRTLAELTLALVLFTDAANANLAVLKKYIKIPVRLLLVGLPLTILLGFGVGVLIFDELTLFEIAILATMLAPTDAALGKAVVSNKLVPANIREGLNVESGLNDGICVPILFVFIALATANNTEASTSALAIKLVVEEIGIGVTVGVVITSVSSFLAARFFDRGWITESYRQVIVPAMAVTCFATAQWLGGSGFIAAFVGGLLFGQIAKNQKPKLLLAAEGTGDTLSIITWIVFGAIVVLQSINYLSWEVVLYSVLSLTVVRMLPVFLVLTGTHLHISEKLFMGWFGPRGLASIVFAVIVLNENLPGGNTIAMTAACTIMLSVIVHGISANPLVAALSAKEKSNKKS